ncbi:MAG: TonB-dependent receptor [Calditrichaeota bacterium]|nr:TonB-dependent receptor [Calditrichota bacterium]
MNKLTTNLEMAGVLCVMIFFIFTAAGFAQDRATLAGNVTDSGDGSPLPGANIVLVGTVMGAASSGNGDFTVGNIPPGTYTVKVSFIGYETSETANVVLSAGETLTMNFALILTGIEMNPISISASRRPEKMLEAPASVVVLDARQIASRPVLTPTEHLKTTPGVDVATTGMNQSNVVVRGFNNIFSGAMLVLVDNRIARVPGLRFNAYNFISTSNEDIEQAEVVLGPGAALYGPGAANGVFHMITKSPFTSQGTTLSVGGGERDLLVGSLRHAGVVNDKFGYKISAQYYKATDWKFQDPEEPAKLQLFRATPGEASGRIAVGDSIDNVRDFDLEKFSADVRFDYHPSDDVSFILSGGLNRANSLELTGIGAGQVIDWTYTYIQARLTYKNLFITGYGNFSDAGDSFNLRSGALIVDKSKFLVLGIQHSYEMNKKQRFTYGFDGLFTRPDTEGTINGLNEDNDNFEEVGVYVQSETDLSSKLKFVAAGRIDKHSRLDDPTFSPRAALVFKPTPTDNFRVTYNRAFSNPSSINLNLDILQAPDAFGTGALFAPAFGFAPNFDIRVQGVPGNGFNFRRGDNGLFMFRSPFAPVAGLSRSDFIPLNDPGFTNVMWAVGRGATSSGLAANLIGAGIPPAAVADFIGQIEALVPGVSNVNNVMMSLDLETSAFFPNEPFDVPQIKESTTQTLEIGYKGILAEKFVVGIDGYYSKIDDFVSPLLIVTPNVFLDPATLAASLGAQFTAGLAADPVLDATAAAILDNPLAGGNGNGSAVDELTAIYTAGAAGIPYGTVTPEEAFDPTALMVTYRNFGDVDFYGLDLSLSYFVNRSWTLTGNYSFVSKDFYDNLDGIADIALNAPKHKLGGSITYRNQQAGFDGNLRLRWVDTFPVATGAYVGSVGSYAVLDLSTNYKLPFSANTNLNLTIQNLLDNEHKEMVGAPGIGRLAMVRLTQSF